ncbi:DUF488 domain-containing protein [Arthrobacter sp. AL08]|uniref:DUF488 domain-containing protein n=1 Tax=unclassified Arthrobacter TaxID=235627 RepID=UPI00249BA3A9|nr:MULTISPECIES: DUF488 domain-containing protein [unclassified Arthrobacter]MDI3240256.1 DUF488 domain-containing protein [Arthrobacter sp. AL05]MDI3276266.1 DUF488 domain-containing protein [Arthrobacter sp. AL08]
MTDMTIFTVGHSTHPIDEFISILKAHGVKKLIDVRTVPRSRHNPQFAAEVLAASVRAGGITYRRMASLGGLRPTSKGSPNGAWRNASFRGYADYMQTEEFAAAVGKLMERGRTNDAAVMCAEAVPWRCHRSLIGDALLLRNVEVLDIMTEKSTKPHALTPFARVDGHRLWYPAE